jgi:hypothetical protein
MALSRQAGVERQNAEPPVETQAAYDEQCLRVSLDSFPQLSFHARAHASPACVVL